MIDIIIGNRVMNKSDYTANRAADGKRYVCPLQYGSTQYSELQV